MAECNPARVFTVDSIRTSEICGLDGSPVTICGIDVDFTHFENSSIENLSGHFITGESLIISGVKDSVIHVDTGEYDYIETKEIFVDGRGTFSELIIGGIKYIPRSHIAYAFYFGGPPVKVPDRFPYITNSNPQLFTGLAAGQNYVFVESTDSFATGDHIAINPGGVYSDGKEQEEQTILGIDYYRPNNCCNAQSAGTFSIGQTQVIHDNEGNNGYDFEQGDVVKIDGGNTPYTVTSTDISTASTRYINVSPSLADNVADDGCICLVQPTLLTDNPLKNNYLGGTYVTNKHPDVVTSNASDPKCNSSCYDSQYLYLESGTYTGDHRGEHSEKCFDWYLTGYREYFIDFSGIDVHATGDLTTGVLTLVYPDKKM